jgi:hypothetical protein
MDAEMPLKLTHMIGAMENALCRRDYAVLSGLLKTFEQHVREVGDPSDIAAVQKLRVASDLGTQIENSQGSGSQLDPNNTQNQHWLRVGMFKSREVPEALMKATYAQSH